MLNIYIHDHIESIGSAELERMVDALPQWRRERALAFKHEGGRRECAVGYTLLCRALREQTDYDFERDGMPRFLWGEHGKPFIVQRPDLHFNISHCRHAVAVAVSDTEVGVDIEARGRYRDSLARYCMNDEELALIASAEDADLAFTELWTRKEAVFKLTGSGIGGDIRNLLVCENDTFAVFVDTFARISPSFVLSVAKNIKKEVKILQVGK